MWIWAAVLYLFSCCPTSSFAGTGVFARCPPADCLYVFLGFSQVEAVIGLVPEGGVEVALVLLVFPDAPLAWLTTLRPHVIDGLVLFLCGRLGFYGSLRLAGSAAACFLCLAACLPFAFPFSPWSAPGSFSPHSSPGCLRRCPATPCFCMRV